MAFSLWSYPNQKYFKVVEGDLVQHDRVDLEKMGHAFVVSTAQHQAPVYAINIESTRVLENAAEFLENAHFNRLGLASNGAVDYQTLVREAINEIKTGGDLQKVVLSRFQDLPTTLPEIGFLDNLRKKYPTAFIALFSDEQLGTWITASPELFLKRSGTQLQSFSLAGTKFSSDSDLGIKEHEEQHFVTNYIKQTFEAAGLSVRVNGGIEHKAGALVHLLNVVEGSMASQTADVDGLISQLHPTPAVCGLPLALGIEFLKKEQYDRQLYTGFLGEVESPTSFELYVNLRSAQLTRDGLRFYAGAGITADSDPEKEFDETQAKMDVLKSVLLSH